MEVKKDGLKKLPISDIEGMQKWEPVDKAQVLLFQLKITLRHLNRLTPNWMHQADGYSA